MPPLLFGNHNCRGACRRRRRAWGACLHVNTGTFFQPLLLTVTTKSRVVAVVQLAGLQVMA